MNQIRALKPEQLADFTFKGGDSRLAEMLFRYRARNYPETLNSQESKRWQQFCINRLSDINKDGFLDFNSYQQQIDQLKQQEGVDQQLLKDLQQYALDLQNKLQI